jgi:hypothetical protein
MHASRCLSEGCSQPGKAMREIDWPMSQGITYLVKYDCFGLGNYGHLHGSHAGRAKYRILER